MKDFIYITSASFSGSTLLTFLLNTHPEIATIGEMKGDSMDVERYRCSCGDPIGRCPFWQRLVTHRFSLESGCFFEELSGTGLSARSPTETLSRVSFYKS